MVSSGLIGLARVFVRAIHGLQGIRGVSAGFFRVVQVLSNLSQGRRLRQTHGGKKGFRGLGLNPKP